MSEAGRVCRGRRESASGTGRGHFEALSCKIQYRRNLLPRHVEPFHDLVDRGSRFAFALLLHREHDLRRRDPRRAESQPVHPRGRRIRDAEVDPVDIGLSRPPDLVDDGIFFASQLNLNE